MKKLGQHQPKQWMAPCLFVAVSCATIVGMTIYLPQGSPRPTQPPGPEKELRILFVDSYHPEYEPGIQTRQGFAAAVSNRRVRVTYVYMDGKRKKSADQLVAAAEKIIALVGERKPDLIVAADDAASQYVISPHLKNSDLPVVFIGVNWSAARYGFPCSNVTGQVEVELIRELIRELGSRTQGSRLGFISGDTMTDRKALEHYRSTLGLSFDQVELVDDFASWKTAYAALQESTDILIFRNNSGISGWDDGEARAFVYSETKIPTGSVSTHLYPLVLIGFVKVNREFGEYAGRTALRILDGVPPSAISVTTNVQSKTYLNMKLAKKLGIVFPMELIDRAHLVSAETKRLLYVNSYMADNEWGDRLEKGLLEALSIKKNPDGSYEDGRSLVEFNAIRVDVKPDADEVAKKEAALQAKRVIDAWKPDAIVASGDVVAKYLIVPECLKGGAPVVFCGRNWDASVYKLNGETIARAIVPNPIHMTLVRLRELAKGNRVGVVGALNSTNTRKLAQLTSIMKAPPSDVALVSDFEHWKRAYKKLQETTDLLVWLNPNGIRDWKQQDARDFILENTVIPTGGTGDDSVPLALLSHVKSAKDQGWEAGQVALGIIEEMPLSTMTVSPSRRSRLYLNKELADRMGVAFPPKLMREAIVVDKGASSKRAK